MNLERLAWLSIGLALASAIIIALNEVRKPQKMRIMNVVWPVTALYLSGLALWAHFAISSKSNRHRMESMEDEGSFDKSPTLAGVAIGTSHCGAGCMLADILSEFTLAATGFTILGSMLWTSYIVDFVIAWVMGIVFQYLAIKPMRPELSRGAALWNAVKADTLSILAFQIGMYAFMALVHLKLFTGSHHLSAFRPEYWMMMQAAMICGFATSFPMNWLLTKMGLKESMQ